MSNKIIDICNIDHEDKSDTDSYRYHDTMSDEEFVKWMNKNRDEYDEFDDPDYDSSISPDDFNEAFGIE